MYAVETAPDISYEGDMAMVVIHGGTEIMPRMGCWGCRGKLTNEREGSGWGNFYLREPRRQPVVRTFEPNMVVDEKADSTFNLGWKR